MTNNSTSWSKYYTPKHVAKDIVSMLPQDFNPTKVIDICAGSGNFLDAAVKKWNDIKAVGIDISLNDINKENKYTLHQMDALNLELLSNTIKSNSEEVKVVLANPPFGKLENSEKYLNKKKKLNSIHNEAVKIKRIEALMLVSNLKLLNVGDYFGAILPENFFTSIRLANFKEMFLNEFTEVVIGKKEKYFSSSDVKTRIFIGKYIGSNKSIKLQNIKSKLLIKSNYSLHRGIDNSKLLSAKSIDNIEVVHFSNFKGIQKLERYYPKTKGKERLIISKNDTLILRVGRNSGFSYQAKKEYINKYVSDYFYLLKGIKLNKKEHQILQSVLIKKRKGVATNYLNKIDIMNSIDIVLNRRRYLD
ncbi:MAG: hypothetical protein COA32_12065 [Fluviicola sp.]|nr:MAG: hypothetical protein COA32_12065 [Fluviicola sp.]